MLEKRDFYINGRWVAPVTPNDHAVIDPSTEEACAVISLGSQVTVLLGVRHDWIQQTNTNTQSIMSMLQQQLDEAQKQSQSLNDQLTRMGDPATVSLPLLDLIKQDIGWIITVAGIISVIVSVSSSSMPVQFTAKRM